MLAFLYKGNKSKLFRDNEEYKAALIDGWTDSPGKALEEKKAADDKVLAEKVAAENKQQLNINTQGQGKKFKKHNSIS